MSRSKAAVAGERAMKATTSRHINLVWPWVLWVAMWVVAEGTYLLFHYALREYLPYMVLFLAVALGGLCAAVWKMLAPKDRRDALALRRAVYALGTAIAAAAWLEFGMIGGPLSPGLAVTWGFGGAVVAVLWNVRMVIERKDGEAHDRGLPSRRSAAEALVEAVTGDPSIRATIAPTTTDKMIDLGLDLGESDTTQAGLRQSTEKLAAAAQVPARSAVVIVDPNNAAKATMRILLEDPIAESLPWPGPTHPGGTPFDPIAKGRYLTGDVAQFCVADETGSRHKCTVGMPRVGKGNGMLIELGNAMTWQETTVIAIDVRKGFQTVEPIVPALDKFVMDKDTARALVTAGIDRMLEGRFNRLGLMGEPVWRPGLGMQFVWLQIEEASFLDLPASYLLRIGKSAGSAGMHLDWSLQTTQFAEMSPNLRRMFAIWAVYGCQDDFDATNLPDELLAAGAQPSKWRDEKPGMNYLSAKGIDRATQGTELRDYLPTRDQLAVLAAQYGSQPLDQFSADLLGPLYHNLPSPVVMLEQARREAFGGAGTPAPTTLPASTGASAVAGGGAVTGGAPSAVAVLDRNGEDPDDPGDYDYTDTDVAHLTDADLGITTVYEGQPMELSYEQAMKLPLQPGEDVPIGDPNDKGIPGYQPDQESVTWVRAAVEEQINRWWDNGNGKKWIRPADFVDTDLCGPLGPRTRGRTWFAKECKRLSDTGRLQFDETTGKYMIVPPAGPATT